MEVVLLQTFVPAHLDTVVKIVVYSNVMELPQIQVPQFVLVVVIALDQIIVHVLQDTLETVANMNVLVLYLLLHQLVLVKEDVSHQIIAHALMTTMEMIVVNLIVLELPQQVVQYVLDMVLVSLQITVHA